jgi:hypothetical protein
LFGADNVEKKVASEKRKNVGASNYQKKLECGIFSHRAFR